jgi:hypothetical protein
MNLDDNAKTLVFLTSPHTLKETMQVAFLTVGNLDTR